MALDDEDGSGELPYKCCPARTAKIVICVKCGVFFHRRCLTRLKKGKLKAGDVRTVCTNCEDCPPSHPTAASTGINHGDRNAEIELYKQLIRESELRNQVLEENKVLLEEKIEHLKGELLKARGSANDQSSSSSDNNFNMAASVNLGNVNKTNTTTATRSFRDVLIVKPKEGNATHSDTRKDLLNSLDPKTFNNVKVRNSKEKGVLILEAGDKQQLETVREQIEKFYFETKKPKKRLPRFQIFDVCNDAGYEEDKLLSTIVKQNDIDSTQKDYHFKMIYKSKEKNKCCNIIVEVDPVSYQFLKTKSHLYVGLNRCKFKEVFSVVRCYKCNLYGHISKDCRNEETCGICAEKHPSKDCKSQEEKCVNCMEKNRNTKSGAKVDIKHRVDHPSCSSYNAIKNAVAQKISYSL